MGVCPFFSRERISQYTRSIGRLSANRKPKKSESIDLFKKDRREVTAQASRATHARHNWQRTRLPGPSSQSPHSKGGSDGPG